MNFLANNDKLSSILTHSEERFRIPRFQRPYSWTEDEINDFWNDLILSSKEENYFLGSVILNYETYNDCKVVDIIDGQQRILTSTILLAVLRDVSLSLDENFSKEIHRQSIVVKVGLHGESKPRIEVGESAKDFFEKYIISGEFNILETKATTAEQKKILNNYSNLKDKVDKKLSNFDELSKKINCIESIYKQLTNLTIIKVRIESEEDAYEIFETTNARGVALSVADLIKNVVFKNIREKDHRDLAKEDWSYIEKTIEETKTDVKRFIRYYWISKEEFVSDKGLFRAIKQKTVDWEEFLNDLKLNSDIWDLIHNAKSHEDFTDYNPPNKHSVAGKLFSSINALKIMGVMQHKALLLSIFRNYSSLGVNPTGLIEFIEKFTFQYSTISKGQTNSVERIYSSYARKIEEVVKEGVKVDANIQTLFHRIKDDLKALLPNEEEFMNGFEDISYKKLELARYILERINSHHQITREHKIDYANVNIEHILPQKPDSDWGVDSSAIKGYVHKLGNLTLIDKRKNSTIQNKVLSEKLEDLRTSEIAITKEFVKYIDENPEVIWNEEQINKRQRGLAEIAYRHIWKI